jgi:hypothetical protein
MTRSDSPYDRHGQLQDSARQQRVYALRVGQNPFVIAHEATGEWRDWRDILDASGVANPFDLMDISHDALNMVLDVETVDGLGVEPVDFSADLCQPLSVLSSTPELQGRGQLLVEDIDFDSFELSFRAPDASGFGNPVSVELSSFTGVDGKQSLPVGVELFDETGRYVLVVELTLDTWMILWLARCIDVEFLSVPGRTELVIPEIDL